MSDEPTAAPGDNDDSTNAGSVIPLDKLTDAQVFSRDPEDYTQESAAETIARLKRILQRYRKARDDDAAIAEEAAKIKATNAKAKKAKAKKKGIGEIVDPFEEIVK